MAGDIYIFSYVYAFNPSIQTKTCLRNIHIWDIYVVKIFPRKCWWQWHVTNSTVLACLSHIGWHDTNGIISIFVMSPGWPDWAMFCQFGCFWKDELAQENSINFGNFISSIFLHYLQKISTFKKWCKCKYFKVSDVDVLDFQIKLWG